jgi:hypothetical protein
MSLIVLNSTRCHISEDFKLQPDHSHNFKYRDALPYTSLSVCPSVFAYIYVCVCVYVCMYICMYVCMHVCMYFLNTLLHVLLLGVILYALYYITNTNTIEIQWFKPLHN